MLSDRVSLMLVIVITYVAKRGRTNLGHVHPTVQVTRRTINSLSLPSEASALTHECNGR